MNNTNEPSTVILQALGLNRTYQQGNTSINVLSDINLTLKEGEQMAVIGASGSGKSTLLHILAGLDTPDDGSVQLLGHDIHSMNERAKARLRNRYMGFIYQFHHLLADFSAVENVAMPLWIQGCPRKDSIKRAQVMLDEVGLGKRLNHRPSQLSGGERQRVAVIRALITQPACILADEPTGNLDAENAHLLFTIMKEMSATRKTALLIVTHDHKIAATMPRCAKIEHGRLIEIKPLHNKTTVPPLYQRP